MDIIKKKYIVTFDTDEELNAALNAQKVWPLIRQFISDLEDAMLDRTEIDILDTYHLIIKEVPDLSPSKIKVVNAQGTPMFSLTAITEGVVNSIYQMLGGAPDAPYYASIIKDGETKQTKMVTHEAVEMLWAKYGKSGFIVTRNNLFVKR